MKKKARKRTQILSALGLFAGIAIVLWWYFQKLKLREMGDFSIVFSVNTLYFGLSVLLVFSIFFTPIYFGGKRVAKIFSQCYGDEFARFLQVVHKVVAGVVAFFLLYIFFDALHLKWILFMNAEPFNEIFEMKRRDIGYFLFQRPFLQSLVKLFNWSMLTSLIYSIVLYYVGFELYKIYLRKMKWIVNGKNYRKLPVQNGKKFKVKEIVYLDKTIDKAEQSDLHTPSAKDVQDPEKKQAPFSGKWLSLAGVKLPSNKPINERSALSVRNSLMFKDIEKIYQETPLRNFSWKRFWFVLQQIWDILKRNAEKLTHNPIIVKDLLTKLNWMMFGFVFLIYFRDEGMIYSDFLGIRGVGYTQFSYWNIVNKILFFSLCLVLVGSSFFVYKNELKKSFKSILAYGTGVLGLGVFYFFFYLITHDTDVLQKNKPFIAMNIQNTMKAYHIDSFYQEERITIDEADAAQFRAFLAFKKQMALETMKNNNFIEQSKEQSELWKKTQNIFSEYDQYSNEANDIMAKLTQITKTIDAQNPEEANAKAQEALGELMEKSDEMNQKVEEEFPIKEDEKPNFFKDFQEIYGKEEHFLAHKDMEAMLKRAVQPAKEDVQKAFANYSVNPVIYTSQGESRIAILSPREGMGEAVFKNRLDIEAVNTHGYGVDLIQMNGENIFGYERFFEEPLKASALIKTPEIFYGQHIQTPALVNGKNLSANKLLTDSHFYQGSGGIKLNALNALLLTIDLRKVSLLLENKISERSKLLLSRNISERAKKALPFLTFDSKPYMMISTDGKLKWIIDAYTVSNNYPFSNEVLLGKKKINYIRHSVRVVVDAYDGKLEPYIIDPNDPLIKVYQKAYPGVFKDEPMPQNLEKNFLYPSMLLEIQAKVFSNYHRENQSTENFYQQKNLKSVYPILMQEAWIDNVVYAYLDVNQDGKKELVTFLPFEGDEEGGLDEIDFLAIFTDENGRHKKGMLSFEMGE